MTPLLLLLTLGLGATGRDPPGAGEPAAAREALPASGNGSLPHGAAESLVGIAGARAQCRAGPCGKLCLPPPELLRALGLPGGATVTRGRLLRLGPALLRACAPLPPSPTPPGSPRAPPDPPGPTATGPTATSPPGTSPTEELGTVETWALAVATGLSLSLSPLLALALLRCPPRCPPRGPPRGPPAWLHALLLGLAGGALSGDALLHLLPQTLGLHDHAGGSHAAGGSAGPRLELLGVLGGVFAVFLLEKLLVLLTPPRREVKIEDADLSQSSQGQGPWALPWTLVAGGAGHSLADGLTLGAAFSASWRTGLATALALLCHELPHALGELAALSRVGPAGRWALALSLGGALPRVPALAAALALGGGGPARAWLGAVGAGQLLGLGLARAVPAMLSGREERPWLALALQSAGLLGGWGLLLLLALYEETLPR